MKARDYTSFIRTFYNDFIVLTVSILILMIVGTIGLIILTGSREEGMAYGLIGGLILALVLFYYLRGQFNFTWTLLQFTLNCALTIGEFSGIYYLVRNNEIAEMTYGYVLVIISIPALISVNKQVLDFMTGKLKGAKRFKTPFQIL